MKLLLVPSVEINCAFVSLCIAVLFLPLLNACTMLGGKTIDPGVKMCGCIKGKFGKINFFELCVIILRVDLCLSHRLAEGIKLDKVYTTIRLVPGIEHVICP